MGVYLAPILYERGFIVEVTSRKVREAVEGISFITGDAQDEGFVRELLAHGKYDVVIDFMVYATHEFASRVKLFLDNTTHYIYLSSYRVFADTNIISESSPRLLDSTQDKAYLETDEYALAKARQENLLRASGRSNWTIIRPAITYSKGRFQLGTLEAETILWRTLRGGTIILPEEMLNKITTMTWAGDVAEVIANLVLNKKAYGEDFNVASSEYHTWSEVADIYRDILGLKLKTVSIKEYITATQSEYQLRFDRMFNRRVDNHKVVNVTKYKKFKRLNEGLRQELECFLEKPQFNDIDYALQARIDTITKEVLVDWRCMSRKELKEYMKIRFPGLVKFVRLPRSIINETRGTLRIRTRMKRAGVRIEEQMQKYDSYKDKLRFNKISTKPVGGIVTLIDYSNYGNIIQRFALQEFLYRNGLNFISYEHSLPIDSDVCTPKHANIAEFVERYVVRREVNSADNFAAYVVGSDQVWRNWNYKNPVKELGFFFLDFVKSDNAKRIAYAASFGKSTLKDASVTSTLSVKIKPLLDKFTAVSMREKSGIEIVKNEWGKRAQEVIDPTLLLKAGDYDRVVRHSKDRKTPTEGIFVYILGPTEENRELIERTAMSMGLGVGLINPYHEDVLPSVALWLKSIRDAKLVITDSFHSTVFAIINNTPFVVVENEVGGIGRIEDLLSILGISSDRIVRRHKEALYDADDISPIQWGLVNEKLAYLREKSAAWLLDSIRGRE